MCLVDSYHDIILDPVIRLNFFRSVPPEFLGSFFSLFVALLQDGGELVRKAGWVESPSDCDSYHADA